MVKVVIDTNVFVSGLLNTSKHCRQIIELLKEEKIKLVISIPILEELIEVLRRPKFSKVINEEIIRNIVELIKYQAIFVYPSKNLDLIKEDPQDNRFLEAGQEGKVDFIISGDKHLLRIKSFKNILILSPKDFLVKLKSL